MRSQSILVLAIAAFVGLIAVFVANMFLRDEPKQVAKAPTGLAKVVVAKAPLYFGSSVTPEHLKLVDWPADAVPPGAFRSVDEVLGGETRVALRPIEPNEPVLASKISSKGGRLSLSGLIGTDKRAATIRVNDVVGVGGFLLPGDRVDVMITRTLPGDGPDAQTITDVLLQNVRVVGVDQDANEAKDKPQIVRAVTVEVTQEQAQKLALGQQVGSLSLALRNLTNVAAETPRTVRLADLRDGATAAPVRVAYRTVTRYRGPSRPRAIAPTVEIVRGTQASSYAVQRYAGL
jgi:pilus assembly protein CpaB